MLYLLYSNLIDILENNFYCNYIYNKLVISFKGSNKKKKKLIQIIYIKKQQYP